MRGGALQQQGNSPAEPKMNLLVPATPGCEYAARKLRLDTKPSTAIAKQYQRSGWTFWRRTPKI